MHLSSIFRGALTLAALVQPAKVALAGSYDLSHAEAAIDMKSFAVRTDAQLRTYMLTGMTRPVSPESPTLVEHLAVSAVNPVDIPETSASRELFADKRRRPATWKEADAACKGFGAEGKTWTLPDIRELYQLNSQLDYRTNVLEAADERASILASSYKEESGRHQQLKWFWMGSHSKNMPEGLKRAVVFEKPAFYQSFSEARPLNYFCIAYFSAPPRVNVSKAESSR